MNASSRVFWTVLLAGWFTGGAMAAEELIENRRGHELRVPAVPPTQQRIGQLQVPEGFVVRIFAENLGKPRMMAVGEDGTVYVTRRESGDVQALRDTDGDGAADERRTFLTLDDAHGITLRGDRMYIATVRDVYVVEIRDGQAGPPRKIIEGMPQGGRHPNRTLAFGPDGLLYVTVGSTCNCCVEDDKEAATILVADPENNWKREIFAEGLRNTIGFGWHPQTRQMWGMDHGSDWLGDEYPPEELNRLEKGKHYGWPFCHGENVLTPLTEYPEGFDKDQWLAKSTPMAIGYTSHAAPLGMVFYTAGPFPSEYRNDAFVTMHGSWNRKPPSGFEVLRVRFRDGQPVRFEPFVTGFLVEGPRHFARPCGIAVAKDGALLVGDDSNGVIYRISYKRPAAGPPASDTRPAATVRPTATRPATG